MILFMASLPVPLLASEWIWEFSTQRNGPLGEQWFGWMRENDSLMKYNLWMDALARLAKNCLLWHYICFLCLFFFKGKEKLKSPLRLGRWMYLARRRRQEHLRLSEVSWEREQWLLSDCKHGLLYFPCFLRRHARPALAAPSQDPNQASLLGLTQSCRVSWRQLFWVRYILACLLVCTTECHPDWRGIGSETPSHRYNQVKVVFLKEWLFFSHRPSH